MQTETQSYWKAKEYLIIKREMLQKHMCHNLVGLLPEIVAHGNNMVPITITLVSSQPFQTCDGFFLIFLILMQIFFLKRR